MNNRQIYDFFCTPHFGTRGMPPFTRPLVLLHAMLESIGESASSDQKQLSLFSIQPFSAVDRQLTNELSKYLGADFHETIHIDFIKKTGSVSFITQKFKEFLQPLKVEATEEVQKKVFSDLVVIIDLYIQLIQKALKIIVSAVQNNEIEVNAKDIKFIQETHKQAETLLGVLNEQRA